MMYNINSTANPDRQGPMVQAAAEHDRGVWTPFLYSLTMVAAMLNVGRSTLHRLIQDGELPTVRIGRRRLVEPRELEAFMARLAAQEEPTRVEPNSVPRAGSKKEVTHVVA